MREAENRFDHDAGPVVVSDILSSRASAPADIRTVALNSLATLYTEPHEVDVAIDQSGGGWFVVTIRGPRTSGQLVLER